MKRVWAAVISAACSVPLMLASDALVTELPSETVSAVPVAAPAPSATPSSGSRSAGAVTRSSRDPQPSATPKVQDIPVRVVAAPTTERKPPSKAVKTAPKVDTPEAVASTEPPSPEVSPEAESAEPSLSPEADSADPSPSPEMEPAEPSPSPEADSAAPTGPPETEADHTETPTAPTVDAEPEVEMAITVNLRGDQELIDQCRGPVDYLGWNWISQHDYCGGDRFFQLDIGDRVRLEGSKVDVGVYEVVDIRTFKMENTTVDDPTPDMPYTLQTCIDDTYAKVWKLGPADE